MKQFILVIFLLIGKYANYAQTDIQFENITTHQGLSAAHVNQTIQDAKGFIWIATANGLNRYDGVDFKVFSHNRLDTNSLSDNNIRCILEDSKGYIWAGTLNNGLNRYDYKTGKFKRYFHHKNNSNSLSSNEILCLFEDSQRRLWIGTENGLNLFDYKTGNFTSFLPNPNDQTSIQSKAILSVGEDHRGWLWVGTWDGGLNLMIPTKNPKKFTFRHFFKGEGANSLKSNHIWKIFLDNKKRLWLGTYAGGLSIMLPSATTSREKFQPSFQTFLTEQPNHPINNNLVFGLNYDKDDQLWVATVHGLSVFKPIAIQEQGQTKYIPTEIRHFTNVYFKKTSLAHNEMRDVFIDNTGLIWCATLGGISKVNTDHLNFTHFLQGDSKGQNISVATLAQYGEERVYIGASQELGLIEYYPKKNTFKSYFNQLGKNSEFIAIHIAHADSLWLGNRNGIAYFNPNSKQFRQYDLKHPTGKDLTNLHVRKIARDKKNRFWLATGAGLVLFDEKKGTFQFFEKDNQGKTLASNDINDILIEGNTIWLATYGGLSKVVLKSNGQTIFKNYTYELSKSNSILSNRVMSLAILNKELWIGTENGLAKYNPQTDDFQNISTKQDAAVSNIVSMIATNDNRIWLGTRQGLVAFLPKTMETIRLNENDGLQIGAFSLNAVFKNKAGALLMGGVNGYVKFESNDIQLNTLVPPVYITDIKIYNQSYDWNSDPASLKKITLTPDQNYFTVEFAALNYIQSFDNQYAYKLEGFNEDWVHCGNQKFVSFSNLDGGTYTLKVRGTNNDGTWNETPVVLRIKVVPVLWKQRWFQFGVFLAIALLSLWVYFRRVGRVERQKKMLKKQVALRTQEITLQKEQIETLVLELREQNDHLEELVKERTKEIEYSNTELKRSNEALEQFAYAASHDMQEPIRMISSFAKLLSTRYQQQLDKDGKEYLYYIIDGAKRMSALISSLLAYSRVGRSDAKFSVADLNKVVYKKIGDLRLKIHEKGADVVVKDLPKEVFCEADQIGIVFYNLINNGLKFNTNPAPQVIIGLEKEDNTHWIFAISDNGIGIDKDHQEKIFEIFHRLHSHTQFEGNGIGLALCKRIIERHNGNIWLESELGKGTTFYFSISKVA
jgi:signal transduction histidine kinase/ligand-binding sensor domain-containing protein